jgi:hypothetical protein
MKGMAAPSENKICNVNEFSDDIGHPWDMIPFVLIAAGIKGKCGFLNPQLLSHEPLFLPMYLRRSSLKLSIKN